MISDLSWVLQFRSDLLTFVFLAFSHLAGQAVLLSLCVFGYWMLNKRFYRDLGMLLCITAMFNVMLKGFFAIPRPGVEHLMATDYGYSFPSGHASAITVAALAIATLYKNRLIWTFSLISIVGCCASRIYLGVHYPIDIIGGIVVGVFTVTLYNFLRYSRAWLLFSRKKHYALICFLVFYCLYFLFLTKDINVINTYASGLLLGLVVGDYVERMRLKFSKPKDLFRRIVFLVTGFLILIPLGFAVNYVYEKTHNLYILFIGYGLIGINITVIVPYLFKTLLAEKVALPLEARSQGDKASAHQ